jgi:hypothetical protein
LSLGPTKKNPDHKKGKKMIENGVKSLKKREPKIVELDYPVEFQEKTYTQITLNRPKGKHLKKMPPDPGFKDFMLLAARVSDVPSIIFEELDGSDTTKIVEVMGDFFQSGQ